MGIEPILPVYPGRDAPIWFRVAIKQDKDILSVPADALFENH
jgi:hypothetical protein